MNDETKKIIDEIKYRRKILNLTQNELALKCGMPQSTIGRIENYSMNPSLDIITSIMKELDMTLSLNKKYMRIQGEELAYKTKKPVGIFVLTWRRVRDGIYSEEDKNTYLEVDKWFKENLPEPPFYGDNNDNPLGATTWFKTNNCNGMLEHIKPLLDLLDKYNVPYEIAYSDNPGKIIYEDDYQVGVIDYDKEEKYELLKMLSESEDDVKNGRLSSIENTFSDNRKRLG